MTTMKLSIIACALGLVSLTGCMRRTITTFEDNAKYPHTEIEVLEQKDYWLTRTSEYRFNACIDKGDKLVCKRLCGSGVDVECPTGSMSAFSGGGTNVR